MEQSEISSDEPRPDVRRRDVYDALPQPGKLFCHPLCQDGNIQCGRSLRENVHGILPPFKAIGIHGPLDVFVGPLEKLQILRRFLMRIVLP